MIPHLPFWTEDDENNAIIMYNRYGIDIEKEIFDAILEAEKEDAENNSNNRTNNSKILKYKIGNTPENF